MITEISEFNLRGNNTFRIDSKCRKWIEYTSAADLQQIAHGLHVERFINIGAGSNMLFVGDFDGVVLHSRILDIEARPLADHPERIRMRIGAGVEFDSLIEQCCNNGLWGAENLSGIPGEVGAAAVQNVGAYGVEACDLIKEVECYDLHSGTFVKFDVDQCDYSYRWSRFKRPEDHNRYIITHVVMEFTSHPCPKLDYGSLKDYRSDSNISPMTLREAVIKIRNEKLPPVELIGSAGSFFKNPIIDQNRFKEVQAIASEHEFGDVPHYNVGKMFKIPAAWLIDKCGFKGKEVGGAAVWNDQPLVIVNISGHATADDILALENEIITVVENCFGINLKPEVEHIFG